MEQLLQQLFRLLVTDSPANLLSKGNFRNLNAGSSRKVNMFNLAGSEFFKSQGCGTFTAKFGYKVMLLPSAVGQAQANRAC